MRKSATEKTEVEFADVSKIREDDSYLCGLGATVYGDDGKEYIVEHKGVAIYPSDKGMEYIAEAVFERIIYGRR